MASQRIYDINAFQVIEKTDMVEIVQVGNHTSTLCITFVFGRNHWGGF
jgi:hypothetical protein